MTITLPSTAICGFNFGKKILSFAIQFFAGLFLFFSPVFAADYYWVGGTGNWSDFANHWATTTGGGTFYNTVPSSADDVFFDANSFTAAGQSVTVDVIADCNNMDWTGVLNTPNLAGASQLNVYGSFTLNAAMTMTFSNGLYFQSANTGNTITFSGVTFSGFSMYFQGGGDWTLQDSLKAPNAVLYVNNGTLHSNNKAIIINSFNSFSSFPRTFDLGASVVNANFWSVFMPGLTIIPGTSVINIANGSFSGGNLNYGDVNITSASGSVNISGSNNFDSLKIFGSLVKTIYLEMNSVQNVNSLSLPPGTCSAMVNLNANGGSIATISMPSGTFNGDYLRISNVTASGGATFNAANSIGIGNTSGWNITNPSNATYFWIGGTGNWEDSTHWSLTSGGAAANCVPTEINNVRFDANSFTGGGQTVTITTAGYCNSINWTGASGTPVFAGTGSLYVYGSFTLINAMTLTATGTLYFKSDSTGRTINTAGKALQNNFVYFDGNGGWTLGGFGGFNAKQIYFYKGSFNTNNALVQITGLQSFSQSSRTFTLGSSIIACNGDWSVSDSTNFDLIAGTSNITISGTNFTGGFQTYNNVTLSNAGIVNINSSNAFNQLTVNNANTINFAGGTTNTATTFSFPAGSCTGYKTLKSSTNGTQATLNKTTGTVNLSFYNIKDMAATGGATFNAANSFDNGNNSGWNFTAPTPQNYFWIGGTGNWSDGTHWSLTSGGAAANCIPTKIDNVFFDANSFNGGAKTVTIDVDASCRSMDWTGINTTNNRILAGANSRSLNIWGSLILNASNNMINNFLGTIYFKTDSAGRTIDLKGKTILGNNTYFDGNGDWTLASAFSARGIVHSKGGLITNNFSVNINNYSSSTSYSRSLTLGSSVITDTTNWQITNGANFTINAGTSIINIGGNNYSGGDLTYNVVNINSAFAISFNGGNTYDTLNFSSSKDISFEGGETNTFNVLSILSGTSCSDLVKIKSLNPGNPANFSKPSGTFTGDYLQITDVTAGGGAVFIASNSYGIGNVTGWTITSPVADDFYWIAGSGNWSDTVHWSLTSGGTPASCVPSILDNVFFDANSFPNADTVTVDVAASCNNIDWTGAAFNPTFAGFQQINIDGSLKFIPAMNNTFNGNMAFTGNSVDTIDFAGLPLSGQISFNGSGTWDLLSDITTIGFGSVTIQFNNGNLNTNDNNFSLGFGSFTSNSAATRTLNLGSSSINTNNWDITNPTGLTLNAGNSAISVTGFGFQFRGGAKNYNVVNLGTTGSVQVSNSNSFDTLNIIPGSMIAFQDSEVQTINILSAAGLAGNHTVFNSMTNGAQAMLNITGGTYCGNYMTLKDISASGGPLYAGTNSIDNGNNSGWMFSDCPTGLTNIISYTDVTCNGANDGTATVTPAAGFSPYTYLWSNGETTSTVTGLAPGLYIVTVTDAMSNTDVDSVTISEPAALSLSTTQTNVTGCTGNNNGAIDLTVSGGTTPYTYLWSNGATTEDLNNIMAGTYTVTVTDANNCNDTTSATITEPAGMSLTFTQTNVGCNGGNNGSATVNVINGYTPVKKTITVQNFFFFPALTTANIGDTIQWTWVNGSHNTTSGSIPIGAAPWAAPMNSGNTTFTYIVTQAGTYNYTCTFHFGMNGTINVSDPLSYDWSTGATTPTITGLSAGTYTVTVDNGTCTRTDSVTITEPGSISLSTSVTDVSCFAGNDGSVDLSVSGGTSPFTYMWSNAANTEDLNGVATGTYSVTVTDANSCTNTTSATISQPAVLSVNTMSTDVSCNGSNDGDAMAMPVGGTSPYTYLWSDGQTAQTATGLIAGNYDVTVTDAKGCTQTASATVNEPVALTITASATSASCNGISDGDASANALGGTPSYSYLWSDGQTTQTATGLSAGNYDVTVTDSNGCTATASATVNEPTLLTVSTMASDVNCNGGNDGTAMAMENGGTSPYTYFWSDGQTTQTATGLSAGNYDVTVTDNNGCTATASATVSEPATALSASATGNDVSCNAGNDGDATVSASGGTSPYSYSWSNGQTSATVTGLIAGTYDVTVTDANGCTSTASTTVNEPTAISLTTMQTDVTCNGGNDGDAMVMESGGTPGYTYLWSDGQTTATATGLTAGNYSATVTDANSCTATAALAISEPTAISISFTVTGASCGNSDGDATANATGGNSGYTYLWSNGQTIQTSTGLAAGNYAVTVTDASSCTQTATASVSNVGAAILSTSITDVSCSGGSNGAINLTLSGGTSPFTFSWSNAATTEDISGLNAGTYNVTVTDANTCVGVTSATISEPNALSLSTLSTDVNCNGGNDGTINLTVSGGTSPFTYLWSNGATTEDLSGLAAAIYNVTVTDANGCSGTTSATIFQPAAALTLSTTQTNVNCSGGNNGAIDLTVSGGTASYSYLWSNAATTEDLSGLSATTYSVTVTDANSCTAEISATISEPAGMSLSTTQTNVLCNSGNDGAIDLTVSGGATPYSYSWSNLSGLEDLTGLSAGNYSVTVTDANSCSATTSSTISEPVSALNLSTIQTNVNCNGGNDGTIDLSVSGGTTSYSYLWSNSATTEDISGLTAGNYSATVTDGNSCTATTSVTISQPASAINFSFTKTNVSCNGGNDGSINLTVSGGTTPYSYLWSNSATTEDLSGLSFGSYTVTVTDANSCSASFFTSMSQPTAISISTTVTDASCGNSDGDATASVSGGTTPYSYLWSNGQTTSTATGLAAAAYSVTVTDGNNCTQTQSVIVNNIGAPAISFSVNNVLCNGGSNGSATANPGGGVSPYTYSWSSGQTTKTINALSAGNYTVTVTDANGCVAVATATVSEPAALITSASEMPASCNGVCDGMTTASASGGTSPYTYLWSNGQTGDMAMNLCAGNYSVTVTDANGCTTSSSITVTEPAVINVSTMSTDVNCNGGSDGDAMAMESGGTSPYTYLWSDGQTTQTATGLSAGNYDVTVADANGCSSTASATVSEPTLLSASASATDANCGSSDGTATVTANGGTTSYSYLWSNGQTSATVTALFAGVYDVTITDASGCSSTASTIVNNIGGPSVTATSTDITCNGANNGTATASASGGNPPYTYLWNDANSQTAQTATGLSAGNYIVLVTDNNGCIGSASASVAEPSAIVLTTSSTNANCGLFNGSTTVIASGGAGSFTYLWNDINAQTTSSATGLASGTYSVTVTDANGCPSTASTVVNNNGGPSSVTTSSTDVNCNGNADGTATAIASGGSPPYTYLWNDANSQTTQTATGLSAGNYSVTVIDANGCMLVDLVTISEPTAITLTLTQTPDSGNTDGTATVVASGGTSPYQYLWTGGQTTATATGLASGMYSVTVTDANGCTATDSIFVDIYNGIQSFNIQHSTFNIYPNPVKNELNLKMNLSNSENVKIALVNSLGQETQLLNREVEKGENVLRFNTEKYSTGIYFLKISSGNLKPEYLKFVKM